MPLTMLRSFRFLLVVLPALLVSMNAAAHTLRPAVATLEIDESGTVVVEVRTNAEALLADIGPEHNDTDDSLWLHHTTP